MALFSKFRSPALRRHRLICTSILTSGADPPLDAKEKSRKALSLIRFERNPERILDICRSAALSPDSQLDRIISSRAIKKLRESNHYEGIRSLIKESMNHLNCKSERHASHFIILYGHGALVNDAVKLFDEMPGMGIERNTKTLNSLLFSCLLAGDYATMKRIFQVFPKEYGLKPDLETYNTILKGLCNSSGSIEAHAILAEMERKGVEPNKTTFAIVIAGFYKEENFIDVGRMLQLMKRYNMQPGISIYNVRIQSLCKLKRSTEAKALLDGILSRGMNPNCETYSHLIYGFCREGKLETAKNLYKEMGDRGLKAGGSECYFTMVYYLCEGGDFEGALSVCKECMLNGWVPNVTSMKSLVDGLVRTNKVDEVREIIGEVKKKFSRNVHIWNEIEGRLPK